MCDYYLTKRGCAKGDRCDFLHEGGRINPSVETLEENPGKKICAYYLSDRGCIKADRCDFDHPAAPNGEVTNKVCEYFQQARGCVKADRCNFLHCKAPRAVNDRAAVPIGGTLLEQAMRAQAHANQLAAAAGMMSSYPTAYPTASKYAVATSHAVGQRPSVPTMASSTGNPRVCTFYQTERGCAKAERCDFIHQGPASATPDYSSMSSYGSGSYGYTYGADGSVVAAPISFPSFSPSSAGGSGSGKVCTFYGTSRGCRKGSRCDFVHPAETGSSRGGASSSARYAPY